MYSLWEQPCCFTYGTLGTPLHICTQTMWILCGEELSCGTWWNFLSYDLLVFLDLLRMFLSVCVCFFCLTNLCFLEANYFPELRRANQKQMTLFLWALHQTGQNLNIWFCWGIFLGKKTCCFWVRIEVLAVIISKSSPLGVFCPIYLCIPIMGTTIWLIRLVIFLLPVK